MPKTVDVRLLRHISKAPADIGSKAVGHTKYGVEFEETSQEIKSAVWWLSADSPHRRILSGEIHLPKDLKPNCRIGKFDLYVSLLSIFNGAYSEEVLFLIVHCGLVFAESPGVYIS